MSTKIPDTAYQVLGINKCEKCKSTGRYIRKDGSYSSEKCYRCSGKGYHDQVDRYRNYSYDQNNPLTTEATKQQIEKSLGHLMFLNNIEFYHDGEYVYSSHINNKMYHDGQREK